MKCLFCDFVTGKRKEHGNGFPFMPLYEMANTMSFLSIDFPVKEDGHTLVIPKEHFKNLDEVPGKILNELIQHVALICKVIKKHHSGYNVLLNDGKYAGQNIMHVHFHIVPRDKGDNIKIEFWKRKKMSMSQFKDVYDKLGKSLEKIKN